jgi:hypothetical protein
MPDPTLDVIVKLQDQFSKQFKKFTGTMVKESEKTAKKVNKSFMSMETVMTGVAGYLGIQTVKSLITTGMQAERLGTAFKNLSKSAGLDFKKTLSLTQAALRGTVSDLEIMQQANNAMLLDVVRSEEEFAKLAEAGRRLGAAMGISASKGLESLVVGIGRQSKLWLDNLGIIVNTEAAYEQLAVSIGKTTEELTDQDRKLAFREATFRAIESRLQSLGEDSESSAEKVDKLTATLKNLWVEISKTAGPAVGAGAEAATWGLKTWRGGIEDLGEWLGEVIGASNPPGRLGEENRKRAAELAKKQRMAYAQFEREFIQKQRSEKILADLMLPYAETTIPFEQKSWAPPIKDNFTLMDDRVLGIMWRMEKESNSIWEKMKEGWRNYLKFGGDIFDQFAFLVEDTFRALETTLGDVFFDAMMGKMKSFKDYVSAFARDMARILSNIFARQAIIGITGGIAGGVKSLFGSPFKGFDYDRFTLPVGYSHDVAPLGPMAAEGGVFNTPVIAGEAGPEAIIPLSGGRFVPVQMKGGGGGQTVNVYLTVNALDGPSAKAVLMREKDTIGAIMQDAFKYNYPVRRAVKAL